MKVEEKKRLEKVLKGKGMLVEHGTDKKVAKIIRDEGFKLQKARMPEAADWVDSVFVVERGSNQTKVAFQEKIDAIISEDAKILVEGSKEFKRIAKGLKYPSIHNAPEVSHRALKEGYDVVKFKRHDTGIIIMNDKVISVDKTQQLTDIWNKAQEGEGGQALLEEAKKFETAEEFVESQTIGKMLPTLSAEPNRRVERPY